jgi:transcriptional regulator with XRE-family HTH domain
MGDYRKYACDLSGQLFKNINKKGVRREKLASELGVSVNQIKNYAYDSSKSATLENFLHALIKYNNVEILNLLANEMGCCVCELPSPSGRVAHEAAAADALAESAAAVAAFVKRNGSKREISDAISKSVQKLLHLEKLL